MMGYLKNDLLLKALKGEKVTRPPVWMMRQAGRYLPEYLKLREKYDFFKRVQTPELACEITLQPIRIIKPDAAIIFSDILVVPQAMGLEVLLEENKGPVLPQTIGCQEDIDKLIDQDIEERLQYVVDAIRLTKQELNDEVPLIGFAGAPFTILCYMVEGKGSKNFEKAKQFCFVNNKVAHQLLQKITIVTISYLKAQINAGADCVQIFDSWSGLLSPEDFNEFALPYLKQISEALYELCPVIVFPKGSSYALKDLLKIGASGIGIDWTISPQQARKDTNDSITLQGNFDPIKLFLSPTEIQDNVKKMIKAFGMQKLIVNLGHGILPKVPVENAQAFIEAVKTYSE